MSTQSVIEDIAAERRRQIEQEEWTHLSDDIYRDGELAQAGAAYALFAWLGDLCKGPVAVPPQWPWAAEWWKPGTSRRMLIKAGALIVAEIERLDRAHG